jgi:hypothetical protein
MSCIRFNWFYRRLTVTPATYPRNDGEYFSSQKSCLLMHFYANILPQLVVPQYAYLNDCLQIRIC